MHTVRNELRKIETLDKLERVQNMVDERRKEIKKESLTKFEWFDKSDRERIALAFKEIRKAGYFARMNFRCCSDCGYAAIPDEYREKFIFFHNQDLVSFDTYGGIRTDGLWFGWAGSAPFLVGILNKFGLKATWDGNKVRKIKVEHLVQ